MSLPSDPFILLSVVNTKLRDQYTDLDKLCEDLDEDKEHLVQALAGVGYVYSSEQNQFI
jgi:hypothetical protein